MSGVVDAFNLSKSDFDSFAQKAVEAATYAVYNRIHELANEGLHSTRQIYKRNIGLPEIGRMKGSITLTGRLPNMLEQGASAFDLKVGFSRSNKAKQTKDGKNWYLTIPFRYATPGSIGESEAFAGVIPNDIQEILKGLAPAMTTPSGEKKPGQPISMIHLAGSKYGQVNIRPAISRKQGPGLSGAQRKKYEHRSPIYAGARRSVKTYEAAIQGQVVSFRRVSKRSAENSWIHRGLKARDFMPQALSDSQVEEVVTRVVTQLANSIG